MKKHYVFRWLAVLAVCGLLAFCTACGGSGSNAVPNDDDDGGDPSSLDYRALMRTFVQDLSAYAKGLDSNFIIIPQNGHQLLTTDGEVGGAVDEDYVSAIDGVGREDLFYGYDNDNQPTSAVDRDDMLSFMDLAEENEVEVLVIDYCSTESYMDDSYEENHYRGYVSFAADHRDLDNIPDYPATPYGENAEDITTLAEARNFLYLINPDQYATKDDFIAGVVATNYDVLITDFFFQGEEEFTADDVTALKAKANGGERLVISYMSIGEAEDYRYYWQGDWTVGSPDWLDAENPDWEGNYKVRYWDEDWQDIIFGNNESYLHKIVSAGFDGVYLDIIDAFEYFEE
ncbi:MAG: hypothetical protein ACD_62C00075G0001 [uncultured bacterium]|nr:MAG: hypothetical protein ACD_62C00075G0001 [uncultured bacterium]